MACNMQVSSLATCSNYSVDSKEYLINYYKVCNAQRDCMVFITARLSWLPSVRASPALKVVSTGFTDKKSWSAAINVHYSGG